MTSYLDPWTSENSLFKLFIQMAGKLRLPRPLADYQEAAQANLERGIPLPEWFFHPEFVQEAIELPPLRDYGCRWTEFRMGHEALNLSDPRSAAAVERYARVRSTDAPWVNQENGATDRALTYFTALAQGREATPSVKTLVPRSEIYERIENLILTIPEKQIMEWELKKLHKKVGPQGLITPIDSVVTLESILRYGSFSQFVGIPYPVVELWKQMMPGNLDFWTDEQVDAYEADHKKGGTSSGFPDCAKRKTVSDRTKSDANSGACSAYPNRRGARGQRQGPEKSIRSPEVAGFRTVYSTPSSKNRRDSKFALAFEAFLRNHPILGKIVAADSGPECLDRALASSMKRAVIAWVLSRDYTKMDTTVHGKLRYAAAKLLAYAFKPELRQSVVDSIMDSWDTPLVYGMIKTTPPNNQVLHRTVKAPSTGEILLEPATLSPEDQEKHVDYLLIQAKDQGLTSGERMTHTLEDVISIQVDLVMMVILLIKVYISFVDGDDGMMFGVDPTDKDKVARYFEWTCRMFGLIGNAEKQDVTDSVGFYLQCSVSEWSNWLPAYSVSMAVNGLLNPERPPQVRPPEGQEPTPLWRDKVYALRSIMILENLEFNPLFEQIVVAASESLPHGCGCKIPGFFDSSPSEVSSQEEIWNQLMGDGDAPQSVKRKQSLKEFRAYKLLKALASKGRGDELQVGNTTQPEGKAPNEVSP